MDLVTCKCSACDAKLGLNIANRWTGIGKSYLTPDAEPETRHLPISTTGDILFGEKDTLIAGCELRRAQCTSCGGNLGLKCLNAPVNHVLRPGRFIFHGSAIKLRSALDGRRSAEPKIKRTLQLHVPQPSAPQADQPSPCGDELFTDFNSYIATSDTEVADLLELQADLETQREDIQQICTAGTQIVSEFEDSLGQATKELRDVRGEVAALRQDGDKRNQGLASLKAELEELRRDRSHSTLVSSLEQRFQKANRAVTEMRDSVSSTSNDAADLRFQLSEAQKKLHRVSEENVQLRNELSETRRLAEDSVSMAKGYASEMSSLRNEIRQLQADLDRSCSSPATAENPSFPFHELDILASSISKIGNRANQVETLQMELDLIKARVKRLEAAPLSTPSARTALQGGNESAIIYSGDPVEDELSLVSSVGPSPLKRKFGPPDSRGSHTTPPKRMEITSDYSSANKGTSTSFEKGQTSSPIADPAPLYPSQPRRAKTGTLGKGTRLKRGPSVSRKGESSSQKRAKG